MRREVQLTRRASQGAIREVAAEGEVEEVRGETYLLMIELVYRKFLLHNFMKNIKTHCICLLFKPQGYLDSSNAVFQYGCMSSYAGHCCSCP